MVRLRLCAARAQEGYLIGVGVAELHINLMSGRVPLLNVRRLLLEYLFAILEQMPQRTYLGEMELMVLLAVVRLGEDAYGVPISKELFILAGREVALGSIYAALGRLEQKAFVTSSLGDPTPERGGRAKRFFRATPTGLRALRITRTALINLWNGIPLLEGRRT
jgi:PadR family transcriptional regulator PadR